MVRKRSRASFEDEFPLFQGLIAGNAATITAMCTPKEAAKCGPGNLSALMLALLLGRDEYLPQLIAAGVPLDVTLSLSSTDIALQKWLAAAQLTDSAMEGQEKLKQGRCALELALLMSKWEQAEVLVAAGADLEPLLRGRRHCRGWCNPDTCSCAWEQVKQYALSHYSGQGWGAAPAARLGQLALLAKQDGQPDMCQAALLAAADRGVQLSPINAVAVMQHAAAGAHVDIVMHMVQHSPGSVWSLLRDSVSFRRAVATPLFPHLAQQFVEGTLELQSQSSLALLVERALQADQPIAAFTVLHAVTESEQEQQQQQVEEKEQEHQQQEQPPLLSAEDLTRLLRCAAATGHAAVAMHLLQRGADVWQILGASMPQVTWSQTSGYNKMSRNVAAVLFPRLARQYAAWGLQVDKTTEGLAVLAYRASMWGCPEACLDLLRLAAAWQVTLSPEQAFILLQEAAQEGQPTVVMYLVEQFGSELLCRLLRRHSSDVHRTVVHDIAAYLLGQLTAGTLQLDSTCLGLLVVRAAECQEAQACVALLQAATKQQVQLTSLDAYLALSVALLKAAKKQRVQPTSQEAHRALSHCIREERADLVEFAKQLLANLQVPLSSAEACELARKAAKLDQAEVLELLLGAGAALDTRLVSVAVRSCSATCVALLLKLGPLPVDLSRVWHDEPGGARQYTCPVLRVLRGGWHRNTTDTSPLRTLEALLAAGHRPTIYRDVRLEPAAMPVAVFDPLKERRMEFSSNSGADRWLWLALGPEGWTPATHQQHPPMLKLAYQAVLLSAACSQRAQRIQEQDTNASPHKLQRLAAAGSATSKASTTSCSSAVLGWLPNELLLHVLHLAARPLSAWLPVNGNNDEEDDSANDDEEADSADDGEEGDSADDDEEGDSADEEEEEEEDDSADDEEEDYSTDE